MSNCAACGVAGIPHSSVRSFSTCYESPGMPFPADVFDKLVCGACWGPRIFPTDPPALTAAIRARVAGGQAAAAQLQQLYVPSKWLPEDERADTPATLIQFPAACPACAEPIAVVELGTPTYNGGLKQGCGCISDWPKLVALRVRGAPEQTPAAQRAPQTFGRCTHCGDVNPYQCGDFLCYQCTQDPWR
jgi:hypothetical protein